jgi:hypothetical protein
MIMDGDARARLPPVIRPDADFRNADWPKKTADIDVDGQPVRRAKKGTRR